MTEDLGGFSGSRKPNPQAVSALTDFDPGRVDIAKDALWQQLHKAMWSHIPRGHCAESNWDSAVRRRESEPLLEMHKTVADTLREFDLLAALTGEPA